MLIKIYAAFLLTHLMEWTLIRTLSQRILSRFQKEKLEIKICLIYIWLKNNFKYTSKFGTCSLHFLSKTDIWSLWIKKKYCMKQTVTWDFQELGCPLLLNEVIIWYQWSFVLHPYERWSSNSKVSYMALHNVNGCYFTTIVIKKQMQRTSTLQKIRANSYQNVIINFSSIILKDSPNLFAARIKIKLKIVYQS